MRALGGEGREGGKRGEGAVRVVGGVGGAQWNTILPLYVLKQLPYF